MSLKDELGSFAEQMSQNAPKDVLETIGSEIGKLVESEVTEEALKVGDTAPDFFLKDSEGNTVSLNDLIEKGPVVISFNRGNWCPFCNMEFKALQLSMPEIQKAGGNLVVISPQLPQKSSDLKQQHGFSYPILYDEDNKTAKSFKISFTLPENLRPIHKAFGMDIPEHNGNNRYELPFPATYVIDQNKKITFSYINVNWMERAEPSEFIPSI